MTECNCAARGDEHPCREALLELAVPVRQECVQDRDLDRWHQDRRGIEEAPGPGAEARGSRENGVAHSGRDLLLSGREHLGDENAFPSVASYSVVRIDPVVRRGSRPLLATAARAACA